jgi:hypothetical protein
LSVLSHRGMRMSCLWRLGPSASPPHCCIAGRLLHTAPVGPCKLLLFACVVARRFCSSSGSPSLALVSCCSCMLWRRCVGWSLIVPPSGALVGVSTLWRFDRRSGTTLNTLRLPSPCARVCFMHWRTLFLSCAGVVSRPWTLCSAFGVDYLFSLAEYRSPYLLCSCHPFSVGRLLDVGLVSR